MEMEMEWQDGGKPISFVEDTAETKVPPHSSQVLQP